MKVTISSPQSFSISLTQSQENTNKVSAINGGVQVPATFGDLIDFNDQNVGDKSVIVYDSATQKYTTLNIDELLIDTVSDGLPNEFVDQLDTDLDNRVDMDGGEF